MTQTAYVIGIGPGMGTAIAARFAREGFRIAGFARKAETLEKARTALSGTGAAWHGFPADAGDAGSLQKGLTEAHAAVGYPDVLVYNVSVLRQGLPSRVAPERFVEDFRSNVMGALVATQAVLPAMRAQKRGTILFTGGGLALDPFPEFASLSVGKAGIRSLALSFAKELGLEGIHVATVTIAGMVKPGTHFDPDAIAEHFWRLHAQPAGTWETEVVYR